MCVCVWTIWIDVKLLIFQFSKAGECGMIVAPHSTKLPQSWDTGSDQPSVPAISISVFEWPPAKPRTGMSTISKFHLTLKNFSKFLGSVHRPIPVRYNWIVFARRMHSTSEFVEIVLSKCAPCIPFPCRRSWAVCRLRCWWLRGGHCLMSARSWLTRAFLYCNSFRHRRTRFSLPLFSRRSSWARRWAGPAISLSVSCYIGRGCGERVFFLGGIHQFIGRCSHPSRLSRVFPIFLGASFAP